MNSQLLYLVEVALCLNLLFGVWLYYLDQLALFAASRWFLLGSMLVSLLLPVVQLPGVPMLVSPHPFFAFAAHNPDVVYYLHNAPRLEPHSPYARWQQVLVVGYWAGVLFFGARLLWQLWQVHALRGVSHGAGWRVARGKVPAWSFFGRIVLNEQAAALPPAQLAQVLEHERTHARQAHTVDTLLAELLTCLLWFNPLMAAIKRELTAQHEFLADRAVTRRFDPQAYSRLILQLATATTTAMPRTAFGNGQVQRRIRMLNAPPQQGLKLLRFALVLPLTGVLLLVFGLLETALLPQHKAVGLNSQDWLFPLQEQFAVVKPFVAQEQVQMGEFDYRLSHKRLAIVAAPQAVLAPAPATVLNVWQQQRHTVPEWGCSLRLPNGQVFVLDGLARLYVQKGQQLQRAQPCGLVGDVRLYPKLVFELWRDEERIDPLTLFQ